VRICDKCVHAEWKRTANGRLHPSKEGRCTKAVQIPALPQAFHWLGNAPRPLGGYIERGEELRDHCVYFARSAP
jgi:hypothetical protein